VQILWINLIVAVALALALAFEASEPDVMERPPRDSSAPLLDTPLIVRTLLVGVVILPVTWLEERWRVARASAAGR
jgi:magnesium-transporting ATPase (P-type)